MEPFIFPDPIEEFDNITSMLHLRNLLQRKRDEDPRNAVRIRFKTFFRT